MKILSIDWDYFMNCSMSDRLSYFPDGGNEDIGSALSTFIWSSRYAFANGKHGQTFDLSKIKVRTNELDYIKRVVDKREGYYMYAVADSHKHLGEFILHPDVEQKMKSELEIVHIDHHHDLYNSGNTLNCGNWLNKVIEKFPEAKITWIRNSDSEDCPEGYNIACTDNIEAAAGEYDMIYLCRSGQWSCPHLDKEFGALNRYLGKRALAYILREEIPNRWDEDMKKSIKGQGDVLDAAYDKAMNDVLGFISND